MATSSASPSIPDTPPTPSSRFEEILDDDDEQSDAISNPPSPPPTTSYYTWNPANPYVPPTMPPVPPDLFSTLPILRGIHTTTTSIEQDNTVSRILPLLSSRDNPLPHLKRKAHIEFLESGIDAGKLPPYMTVLDASRPWIVYWCITGLSLLGIDVSKYRDRVISTFTPMQNPDGGFGGGFGQLSHLAPTYAAVLSLASVGASALDLVDRRTLLKWLHSVKNPDGSFRVCVGGETDVRGTYCALTVISLLRLPTDHGLLTNTTAYLAACQTYEGGFAATPNMNEAHGGYMFCALAGLCILHPPAALPGIIDMSAVLRWLSARQYAPEGGLSGRTNKLVDGCYSTWVGGCWSMVEAAVGARAPLWSREGMIRYVLAATQFPHGGLRDKPGKGPDSYHSNYVLLGFSAAMHHHYFEDDKTAEEQTAEEEGGLPLLIPFRWRCDKSVPGVEELVEGFKGWPEKRWGDEEVVVAEGGLEGDRVAAAHPVFNIRVEFVEEVRKWGEALVGV